MFYAITQDDLEWIIDAYLRQNGGKPFRRIIILSHAGGGRFGPALNLRPGNNQPARMFYNSRGRTPYARTSSLRPKKLRPVFRRALGRNGILVLGSCGHAGDTGPGGQAEFNANVQGWASTYGVPTYAPPTLVLPNLGQGVVAADPQSGPIPFVGYDPDGNRLP